MVNLKVIVLSGKAILLFLLMIMFFSQIIITLLPRKAISEFCLNYENKYVTD